MYLLETRTLVLHLFFEPNLPDYAILSHRWEEEEVLFGDIHDGAATITKKLGFTKVKGCCDLARTEGWEYVWIDSCCIDKSSSAELSEAVNSMFRWYETSQVCYVYLSDVLVGSPDERISAFHKSKWFTRDWTLQELLAPRMVVFYDQGRKEIGTRKSLKKAIKSITAINYDFAMFQTASVAQKMSWAARRRTSRVEDVAYCLMGLFGVYMTVLYGEGENAFQRLQLEIISNTDDDSTFAWTDARLVPYYGLSSFGLLAHSPSAFKECGDIQHVNFLSKKLLYTTTNRGLRLESLCFGNASPAGPLVALLDCSRGKSQDQVGIYLERINDEEFQRIHCHKLVSCDPELVRRIQPSDKIVYVKQRHFPSLPQSEIRFSIDMTAPHKLGFHIMLSMDSQLNVYSMETNSPTVVAVKLTPGMVDGRIQDKAGALFVFHDMSQQESFGLTVDVIDERVGVNIILARGNRFDAATKFKSLFSAGGGSDPSYGPLDNRRLDRVSRVLQSGRSASVALHNGRGAGQQCYIVRVTIEAPEEIPWPDEEGEEYVITDERYEEFLASGSSPHEGGQARQCSWARVSSRAHKIRALQQTRGQKTRSERKRVIVVLSKPSSSPHVPTTKNAETMQ